jgi:hypothetical protein
MRWILFDSNAGCFCAESVRVVVVCLFERALFDDLIISECVWTTEKLSPPFSSSMITHSYYSLSFNNNSKT